MLRVELRNAKPGMTLALPVSHPLRPGKTLLKVEYRLTGETIARMAGLGVRHLWVRYPSLAFLERFVDPQIVADQGRVLTQITDAFNAAQQSASAKLPFDRYVKTINNLIEHLVRNPQAAVFLGDLADAGDDLMRHSSTVTYLSLLLGLKLEGYLVRQRKHIEPARAAEVTNLGLGAMVHDIGVTRLTEEVRQAYNATGDESAPAWREHPALGYELVRGRIAPSAATVVLNHHQRYDGSGYAGRRMPLLREQRIHVYARIVAVADQFDHLRRPPHAPPLPTVGALGVMQHRSMAGRFDPLVLRALLTVVPPYAPGSIVRLNDRRFAAVIDHQLENPCRPTVQLIPHPARLGEQDEPGPVIDLAAPEHQHLFIAEAEGKDVSRFNYAPPPILNKQLALALMW